MQKHSWMIAAAVLTLGGAAPLRADDAPATATVNLDGQQVTLARYAKAFVGPDNITVEVAPYSVTSSKKGAIIIIKGIESDWDGKAVNHRIESGSWNGFRYVRDLNGHKWATLEMRDYGHDGLASQTGQHWLLNYPKGPQAGIDLTPSDGASQSTTPRAIYEEYQRQHAAKE